MKRMLTSQELQDLEALLPPGQVLWGEAIGPDWTHDELSGVSGVPGPWSAPRTPHRYPR